MRGEGRGLSVLVGSRAGWPDWCVFPPTPHQQRHAIAGLAALVQKYKSAIEKEGSNLALMEVVNDRRPRKLGTVVWLYIYIVV